MTQKTLKTISQDFALTFLNFVNQNPPRLTLFKSCEPSGTKILYFIVLNLNLWLNLSKFCTKILILKSLNFTRKARYAGDAKHKCF
ncbi:MAG: hypothetical protein Q3967_05320 [Campylobacter sp.]|nr:hypothetical protein [Campylobacter sp.]